MSQKKALPNTIAKFLAACFDAAIAAASAPEMLR
jgi:hypothetical protein